MPIIKIIKNLLKNKRPYIKAKCIDKKELQLGRLIAGHHFCSTSLFNGLKERSCWDAFNHIFFDIFVLNIDGEIDRQKVSSCHRSQFWIQTLLNVTLKHMVSENCDPRRYETYWRSISSIKRISLRLVIKQDWFRNWLSESSAHRVA